MAEVTKTSYTILGGAGDHSWRLMGEVVAAGQTDAIRQYTGAANGAAGGVYVAVPTRSWRPLRVEEKVTKTTRLIPAVSTPAPTEPE